MKKQFSTVVLLIVFCNLAHSQQDTLVVKPGDDIIDGSIIQAYTNKWKVTYLDASGNQTPNKIWTDYGQIIELEGKTYFHRVQDLYDPSMNLLDTWINMVEHKTLIPVTFSTLSPNGKFLHNQFSGNKITGRTNQGPSGETTEIDVELEQDVFDWNLYGMLLIGLPLKEGLIAKMPFYSSKESNSQWLIAQIDNSEVLEFASGKKYITRKVLTNQNLTFWLSEAIPYVIKLELALQNDAKLVWEIY